MPALFAYLVAVTLLLGGGYGALSWLATPEPVKVVAKATPKPPTPHYADDPSPVSTQANAPQVSPPETSKPEAPGKPEISGTDQVKAAANDKAVSSEQPPPAPSSPQPALQRRASRKRRLTFQIRCGSIGIARPKPRCLKPQPTRTPQQHAEAPPVEARLDDSAPAGPEEEKQSSKAAPPGNAQTVASIAPVAKTAKRPRVRQASRGLEKRPLEVMTLRTIELPDGRRMTRLIPYRGGDRYRDDGPAMAFGPDE